MKPQSSMQSQNPEMGRFRHRFAKPEKGEYSMTVSDPANPATRSLTGDVLYAVRYYLGGRTGLIAVAAAALGLGAYANWGWLVAAGLAPILLAMAPCAVMCALGMCMKKSAGSAADERSPSQSSSAESGGPSSLRLLTPPGETQDASPISSRQAQENPSNRKGCC